MAGGPAKRDSAADLLAAAGLSREESEVLELLWDRDLALVRLLRTRDRLPAIGTGAKDAPVTGGEDCSTSCPDPESQPGSSGQPGSQVETSGVSPSIQAMADADLEDLMTKPVPARTRTRRGAA